jgi:hypothetical protein
MSAPILAPSASPTGHMGPRERPQPLEPAEATRQVSISPRPQSRSSPKPRTCTRSNGRPTAGPLWDAGEARRDRNPGERRVQGNLTIAAFMRLQTLFAGPCFRALWGALAVVEMPMSQ